MHPSRNAAGVPAWLITHARTGLPGLAVSTAFRIADGNLFGAGDHRRDEQDDQRVDPGVGKEQRQRGRVGDLGGRSEQVDGIRGARLCGQDRRECLSRLVGEIGKCKPGRCAGVGAQDPEPARVRYHGDASAARQRLARKQRCRVDELLERSRPDYARLPEQRIGSGVGTGERGRVGARGMGAGRGRSRLEHDDRLATGHTPGDPSELARVAERLEVEQDHGPSRRRPPTTRASRSMRRPPCSRSRRRTKSQAGAP